MQTYTPVPDEILAEHLRDISLDMLRKYIHDKVKLLQSLQQDCPDALISDVTNVIGYLQVATIDVIVKSYIKLMETLRFWWEFSKERGVEVEQKRKLYQRSLKDRVRASWNTEKDGKQTIDAVDAKVRMDQGHDNWLSVQRHWEALGNQLHQIITSVQTEILVQASMWERAQDIGNTQLPPGAVSGPAQ